MIKIKKKIRSPPPAQNYDNNVNPVIRSSPKKKIIRPTNPTTRKKENDVPVEIFVGPKVINQPVVSQQKERLPPSKGSYGFELFSVFL